ncbi:MAG: Asp-tRNA(Asn)/Glu-tRNA(Gln) amidotransferase subunit GatC [Deltaproteobacteria bacterium]|nr:Asp-tRNA(Asn)/Glu-tRNA(Gln) amidotransferase subunit GatC [Deltaproteobacteria bacterium]
MKKIIVDDKLIEHLLSLANIEIERDQFEKFKVQIQRILDYIAMLDELNTEGVPPMFSGIECPSTLRLDITQDGLSLTSAIQNAPAEKEGLFEIPKVID